MKTLIQACGWLCMLSLISPSADACRFTPLEWQQIVRGHANPAHVGQRKHTTWSRDQNRDFIDDRIADRFKPGQLVNVVVDLNRCTPVKNIAETFAKYGRISHVSRLITSLMIDDVNVSHLSQLAAMDIVAMVEWQGRGGAMNDISTRAVQAHNSATYSSATGDVTAEELGLTGKGTLVAILDAGVDDTVHEVFQGGKFVAGFNARHYEDSNNDQIDDTCQGLPQGDEVCEPQDGTTNPRAGALHGTHVAGIAIGSGAANRECRDPNDGSVKSCAGVASGASLVDIQVLDEQNSLQAPDLAEAIEWIATKVRDPINPIDIRVANMSLALCEFKDGKPLPDDGTSDMPMRVNALVSNGVFVAVAHGNASRCGVRAGNVHSVAPGTSALAITVAGTYDGETVSRDDDTFFMDYMRGPLPVAAGSTPTLAQLKPDIAAPGQWVNSAQAYTPDKYYPDIGTSMATPHVAGAAAVIIEARPTINPQSLKDLLKSSADPQHNANPPPYPGVDPKWDSTFGSGLLDIGAALAASRTDVLFPSCVGPGWGPESPCAVNPPLFPWHNDADLRTASAPRIGVPNAIIAKVKNAGPVEAVVNVNFGIYHFAAGNNQFFPVGTQRITIPAGTVIEISQPWTPDDNTHQCVQVRIDFGLDSNFSNNVTQLNLVVSPSIYDVRIENPFLVPAKMTLKVTSDRERDGWKCSVNEPSFTIDPLMDCPRSVRITFDAPAGAAPGESANCHVEVTARPRGGKAVVIGGVTARTYVPKPCRAIGTIVDAAGRPLDGAKVIARPAPKALQAFEDYGDAAAAARAQMSHEPDIEFVTDEHGVFTVKLTPDIPYVLEVSHHGMRATALVRLRCGTNNRDLALTRDQIAFVD